MFRQRFRVVYGVVQFPNMVVLIILKSCEIALENSVSAWNIRLSRLRQFTAMC